MTAAITKAFDDTFLVGAGIALLSLILVLTLREVPLRTTIGRGAGEGQAALDARDVAGLAD
jgi:hypothetical protein